MKVIKHKIDLFEILKVCVYKIPFKSLRTYFIWILEDDKAKLVVIKKILKDYWLTINPNEILNVKE